MLQVAAIVVILNLFATGLGWAAPCDEGCRNSTTFNPVSPATGSYWVARRGSNSSIQVYINGSLHPSQPGGTTPNIPAIEGFGSSVHLVVRGTDNNQGVWWSRWNGISWTPWMNVNTGSTTNSPDMVIFNNTLFLVVSGTDLPNRGLWVNRYTTNWLGWNPAGNLFTSALTSASSSNIRVGGIRTVDGQCWKTSSTNGTTWTAVTLGSPCP